MGEATAGGCAGVFVSVTALCNAKIFWTDDSSQRLCLYRNGSQAGCIPCPAETEPGKL